MIRDMDMNNIHEKPQGTSPLARGGFYVTIRDGSRFSLALGPFETHKRARFELPRVKRYVGEHYNWASFWFYGTSRVTCGPLPKGKLNAVLFSQLGESE